MRRIPFGTIRINEEAKRLIADSLSSGRLSCGTNVRAFEKRFAGLMGTKEAVAVGSGTDAIALALAVLYDFGVKRGDEVIMPALSFVATANAVLQAGFIPVFADIEEHSLNIDPSKIDSLITDKTRAILPVHLMGKPANIDAISNIAKAHNLPVIYDAAEAHGAEYKGRNIAQYGDMTCYSLYVAHIISTIEGGIICTDNLQYAEILRSLRSHGRACKCESCVLNKTSGYCAKRFETVAGGDIRFYFERVGFSSKMNELEAAIGIGSLLEYDDILLKRRQNLYYLMEGLKRFDKWLFTINEAQYERIGPHAFPFVISKHASFNRNQLTAFLEKRGIDTRDLFSSIPTQCQGYSFLGYQLGDFPKAEYIGCNGMHIGVHQDITKDDCDYILGCFDEFFEKYT